MQVLMFTTRAAGGKCTNEIIRSMYLCCARLMLVTCEAGGKCTNEIVRRVFFRLCKFLICINNLLTRIHLIRYVFSVRAGCMCFLILVLKFTKSARTERSMFIHA